MLDAADFQWLAAANLHNLSALSSQAVPPGAAACNQSRMNGLCSAVYACHMPLQIWQAMKFFMLQGAA